MRSIRLVFALTAGLGLSACVGLNDTQQRTATGALGGGAIGGLLGSFGGNAGLGALLGAGVGGAGGYLYDRSQQSRGYGGGYDRGYGGGYNRNYDGRYRGASNRRYRDDD